MGSGASRGSAPNSSGSSAPRGTAQTRPASVPATSTGRPPSRQNPHPSTASSLGLGNGLSPAPQRRYSSDMAPTYPVDDFSMDNDSLYSSTRSFVVPGASKVRVLKRLPPSNPAKTPTPRVPPLGPLALTSLRTPHAPSSHAATPQSVLRQVEQRRQQTEEVYRKEGDAHGVAAMTRNADPTSVQILQLVAQSDALPASQPTEKLALLQQCYPLLKLVTPEWFDTLAVLVYQKEGEVYYQQGETEHAKEVFSRAITLAEMCVARGDKDVYMILKRYVLCMVGMARIWYEHERDITGFKFVNPNSAPVVTTAAEAAGRPNQQRSRPSSSASDSSLHSLESSFSSVDSVFSVNRAILNAMAPRPPRRRAGPRFSTVKLSAPKSTAAKISAQTTAAGTRAAREDEFVLHSKMNRALIASPCELLLLRCCEVVQFGHNYQSELLIPCLLELSRIYEDLELYSRALLLVRRCLGILCSVYDYDHPWVVRLNRRVAQLNEKLRDGLKSSMAVKIQATWKMHREMVRLARALGHPVHRHVRLHRKINPRLSDRADTDAASLGDFADAMGHVSDGEDVVPEFSGPPVAQEYREPSPPPEEEDEEYDEEAPAQSMPVAASREASPVYATVQNDPQLVALTTLAPSARVLGTVQHSQTDSHVQHTPAGEVLTVRTTTVTKTLTEKLPGDSDDEEDGDEDRSSRSQDPTAHPGTEVYMNQPVPTATASAADSEVASPIIVEAPKAATLPVASWERTSPPAAALDGPAPDNCYTDRRSADAQHHQSTPRHSQRVNTPVKGMRSMDRSSPMASGRSRSSSAGYSGPMQPLPAPSEERSASQILLDNGSSAASSANQYFQYLPQSYYGQHRHQGDLPGIGRRMSSSSTFSISSAARVRNAWAAAQRS